MFFKKAKPQGTQPELYAPQTLAWASADAELQQMWVSVSRWEFRVEPSLQAQNMLAMDFKFDGIAATGPLRGLRVSASLELRERDKPPEYLTATWPDHCSAIQGCADAGNRDGYGTSLDLTLFCQPGAFDWIYRVFLAGATLGGSLGYSVYLDCPTSRRNGFWTEDWLRERLRVREWSLESDWERVACRSGDV